MGKKIITKQDVERWYFEGKKEIYLDDDTMLLPGAKDTVRAAGMRVVIGENPELVPEASIKKAIEKCCDDAKLTEADKEKVVKAVIAKFQGKIGGE